MVSRSGKTILATLVILAGLSLTFVLTGFVEQYRPALPSGYTDEDMAMQGSQFKGFAFGAEGLIADWYWMNSLQYIGGKIASVGLDEVNLEDLRPLNPRLLYPYLNNATELDPRFVAPYLYGATILPAIDRDQAVTLTERGIANNPDEWRLHQYLGYIYWRIGNYDKAAETYGKGSQIPGAPPFMRMMSARMRTEGGSRDIAREIYKQILSQADGEQSRQNAQLRLLQIDSLDERDRINAALNQFRDENKRCPSNWSELLPIFRRTRPADRDLRIDRTNSIVDPSGVPYFLNRDTCTAELGAKTKIPRA
jgi:tetratricopeptide (TPR) repeat protein